jgi:methylmalonyl-CoA epimerase
MSIHGVDHTAIAVRNLDEALERYRKLFGIEPTLRRAVPDQHVEVAFLPMGGTQLELIQPVSAEAGVARFLERHGESLHHVAFSVTDIESELARLDGDGVELIDREPRRGVHGRIAFVHPRGTGGVLVELVEQTEPID